MLNVVEFASFNLKKGVREVIRFRLEDMLYE